MLNKLSSLSDPPNWNERILIKIPKKRGRKPKEIFKPSEPSNTPISEEAVILHLNIKNNNSSILNIEDEFVKYNPNINIVNVEIEIGENSNEIVLPSAKHGKLLLALFYIPSKPDNVW